MAYKKKKRTGGMLAPRKSPDFKEERELPENKVTKGKGRKSGSRQHVEEAHRPCKSAGKSTQPKDARVGSKKPIPLVAPGQRAQSSMAPVREKKHAATIDSEQAKQDELARLEQNPKLMELLDKSDDGVILSAEQEQWLETQLNRIDQLMSELGIEDEDDELLSSSDDWDQLASDDWSDLINDKDHKS